MDVQARSRASAGGQKIMAGLFPDVWDDVQLVEKELFRLLRATNPLLVELGTHLLGGGGKRLRPALVLMAARPFEYRPASLLPVAASVELIHMATLVHDDVVDRADVRRGVATVNSRWDDRVSVLLGDYLFAAAFSTLAAAGDNRVVRVMADVVFRMSAGEIEQLTGAFDVDRSIGHYLAQIDKKTAYFIGECCRVGALTAGASDSAADTLRRFGYAIGMGFQIADDILDLAGTEEELGKLRGTDLRSGIYTLPVLYALRHADEDGELRALLTESPLDDRRVEQITARVQAAGGLDFAYQAAGRYVQEAKDCLAAIPDPVTRTRLAAVADFVAARRF
ncbi:MAG: polyprenyl synthetase family protein [Thermaerobacterales bacterium]